jgi:hypothetical protein
MATIARSDGPPLLGRTRRSSCFTMFWNDGRRLLPDVEPMHSALGPDALREYGDSMPCDIRRTQLGS